MLRFSPILSLLAVPGAILVLLSYPRPSLAGAALTFIAMLMIAYFLGRANTERKVRQVSCSDCHPKEVGNR